jgi:hypothetical protein
MQKLAWLLILSLIIICGCGAKSKRAIGPDGRPLHHISCGGIQNSFEDCLEKAGELCPQGYDVLGSQDNVVHSANPFGGSRGVNPVMTQYKRNLTVQCKENRGRLF